MINRGREKAKENRLVEGFRFSSEGSQSRSSILASDYDLVGDPVMLHQAEGEGNGEAAKNLKKKERETRREHALFHSLLSFAF